MSAVDELEKWYQEKKASGEVVDLKITAPEVDSSVSPEVQMERTAKAILETIQGKRNARPLDTSVL